MIENDFEMLIMEVLALLGDTIQISMHSFYFTLALLDFARDKFTNSNLKNFAKFNSKYIDFKTSEEWVGIVGVVLIPFLFVRLSGCFKDIVYSYSSIQSQAI